MRKHRERVAKTKLLSKILNKGKQTTDSSSKVLGSINIDTSSRKSGSNYSFSKVGEAQQIKLAAEVKGEK